MPWQADFSSREEFEAASPPAGVTQAQFDAARAAARALLDSGHVVVLAPHPEYAQVERVHNGPPVRDYLGNPLPNFPGAAPRPQATVRIRLGGHHENIAGLHVSVSEV